MRDNKWLDAVMGVATGDALGLPVQFMSRAAIAKNPVTDMMVCDLDLGPTGIWSDDTSMTMAMLDSIKGLGRVDVQDIMECFVDWLFNAKYCSVGEPIDIGATCYDSINRYYNNRDVITCGKTGEYANGNGSLMRNIPISLFYAEKVRNGEAAVDKAIRDIHAVSALTHNHLRACMACGMDFFLVYAVLYEEGSLAERLQKGIDAGFKFYGADPANHREMAHYDNLMYISELAEFPESKIRSTGYVVDTFEAAIWSLVTTDNYRDAMLKAVNLGDDTDTIAAIAGGLAGLYYGYDSIPEEWLSELVRREWLEEMCRMDRKK